MCDGSAHLSGCVVNGIIISVLQSVEREFQSQVSVVQTKDRELAEAQQQLRQKVSVKSLLVTSEIVLMSLRRNSYYPVRGRKGQLDNN